MYECIATLVYNFLQGIFNCEISFVYAFLLSVKVTYFKRYLKTLSLYFHILKAELYI